jgi:hypothetical protein
VTKTFLKSEGILDFAMDLFLKLRRRMLMDMLLGVVSKSTICPTYLYGQAVMGKLTIRVVTELCSWEHLSSLQCELNATHD